MPNELIRSYKENLSIHAIEGHILLQNLPIVPYINSGDKEVSFDGYLQVNERNSDEKKSFIKKVDVQVKSKEVKRFSGTKARYSMELDDIRNYYKQHGCLLLLVQIRDQQNMKIYYKQLLPLELYEILEEEKRTGKKTKSIEFRELDETNLYAVCMKFISESERQPKSLIELENKPKDFTSMRFSSVTIQGNPYEDAKELLDHTYMRYGFKDGVEYPLDTVTTFQVITEGLMTFAVEKKNGEFSVYQLVVTETIEKGKT